MNYTSKKDLNSPVDQGIPETKNATAAQSPPLFGRGTGGGSFVVIGIDDNRLQYFSPEIKSIIASGKVFSGGKRHHEIMRPALPDSYQWIDITVPLDAVFETYKAFDEIIIFASGDPLFYGFANTIQREMPDAEIRLYPTFNSLQTLAHRILMPYHDVHIVSLTGRSWDKLDEALIHGFDKIGILTDNREHIPSHIAKRMLDYGYDNYTVTVGELLGNNEKEKISVLELNEVAEKTFTYPNNLILQKTHNRPRPFGIPENEFHLLDGRIKMITKMPVRLITLSMLDLRNKKVFWDIGACTGSVSIEAKLQFPQLKVIAFEKRMAGKELMSQNAHKFGTPGIEIIIGDFIDIDLANYPRPDAVFIGGHSGKLIEILTKLKNLVNDNGTVVFNSVSAESRGLFLKALQINDFQLNQSHIITVNEHNTIEIMQAYKR